MAFVPLTYQSCNTLNKIVQNISWRKLHYWMESSLLTLWDRVSFPKRNWLKMQEFNHGCHHPMVLVVQTDKDRKKGSPSYSRATKRTQLKLQRATPLFMPRPPMWSLWELNLSIQCNCAFYFLLFNLHPCACVSWWFCLCTAVRFGDCRVSSPIRLSFNSIFHLCFISSTSFPFSPLIPPLLASQL